MSFPAYSEYKDSGIDWLGTIPTGWNVGPIRKGIDEISDRNWDDQISDYLSLVVGRGVIPYAEKGDVGNKKPEDLSKCKIVSEGDFVLNSMNFGIGAFGRSKHHGVCSPVYVVMRALPAELLPEIFAYLMQIPAVQRLAQSFGNGILAHRAAIGWDELKGLRIAYPPMQEQGAIAAFLDHETAKIDVAVAAQERLIALLAEKRAATISHAVTKGLDPSAPMKDSGIEWLGQIPAHWNKMPLRTAGQGDGGLFLDGDWIESKDLADDGLRYLTTGNVGPGFYKEQGSGFISEETFDRLKCTEVLPGDVLVSRLNAPVGRACRVPKLRERIVTSVDNVIVRTVGNVDPDFLVYLLSCSQYFQHNDTMARGTTMQRVSRTILGNVRIPLPPPDEQRQIAGHLNSKCAELDRLTAAAKSVIGLLIERRAALISAAVTGKIDVRGEVEAEEQEAA